jgi:hypothetical protein
MKLSKEELREMVQFWAQSNQRASWFSIDELIEIAYEAADNLKKQSSSEKIIEQGREFSRVFDHLIFVKSITEGKFPK